MRRHIAEITEENCAAIPGGTLGLHAVLSMIAKRDPRQKCVVLIPNYAPIIDEIASLFEIEAIALKTNFTPDMEQLERALQNADVACCVISWPHNPAGFGQHQDTLQKIIDICLERSIYCIMDEIVFSPYKLSIKEIESSFFVSINSSSKTYNIPGLKLGHILASKEFIRNFYRYASTTYGSPPSFLYFTLALLSIAETNSRSGQIVSQYPDPIRRACSNTKIIQEDFDIWLTAHSLVRSVHIEVVRHLLDVFAISRERVFGLDDASPNFVLRCLGGTSSYQLMLNTVQRANVAVFPIDCFAPPPGWPCDIRITYGVAPHKLGEALAKVFLCN